MTPADKLLKKEEEKKKLEPAENIEPKNDLFHALNAMQGLNQIATRMLILVSQPDFQDKIGFSSESDT